MRYTMILLVFGILLFGCVNPPPGSNETDGTSTLPVITSPNSTVPNATAPQNVSPAYTLPPGYLLSEGDYAWVWYTLWVDGEVFDTNNASIANESGIYSPGRAYSPLGFSVELNEGMINGFILNVLGMEINETLVFEVKPELGYGLHDSSQVAAVPRYYNKSLYETVPRAYFEERGLNVSEGTGYSSPYGTVFIDSFNDENVTLFYMMQPGQTFTLNGIPQKVVATQNLTAVIEYALEEGETYYLPDPETGAPTMFTVAEKTDDSITLDANHPLAGKSLRFSVTLIDAVPAAYR